KAMVVRIAAENPIRLTRKSMDQQHTGEGFNYVATVKICEWPRYFLPTPQIDTSINQTQSQNASIRFTNSSRACCESKSGSLLNSKSGSLALNCASTTKLFKDVSTR